MSYINCSHSYIKTSDTSYQLATVCNKMVSTRKKCTLGQITKRSCKKGRRDRSAVGTWQCLNFGFLAVVMLHQKMEAVFYLDIYRTTRSYIPQYLDLNPLKSSCYFTYHKVSGSKLLRSSHNAFMCFVWIWEHTAIISAYIINWLVLITEAESIYCAVRTEYLIKIAVNLSLYVFAFHLTP